MVARIKYVDVVSVTSLRSRFMDGIPWQIAAPIVTTLAGGFGWVCKKIWTLVETHAERRTKGIEAIAPSVKATFDEMRKHVTEHADKHAETVQKAEANIITAVNTARTSIVESIELSKRLERLETASLKANGSDDPTQLERSEPRASRPNLQPLRETRPAVGR
jgi:uncharacterized membrane protein